MGHDLIQQIRDASLHISRGPGQTVSKFLCIKFPGLCFFILANSAYPYEMPQLAVFHQGLHFLLKYPFIGFQYVSKGLK